MRSRRVRTSNETGLLQFAISLCAHSLRAVEGAVLEGHGALARRKPRKHTEVCPRVGGRSVQTSFSRLPQLGYEMLQQRGRLQSVDFMY